MGTERTYFLLAFILSALGPKLSHSFPQYHLYVESTDEEEGKENVLVAIFAPALWGAGAGMRQEHGFTSYSEKRSVKEFLGDLSCL